MKPLLKSKTVWVAIAQAIISVLIVVNSELDAIGYVGVAKSALDIFLRYLTVAKITKII
jgi:hypothetical protein